MKRSLTAIGVALGLLLSAATVKAYPLDGFDSTGIRRLWVQRQIQEDKIPGKKRPPGELLPLDEVDLRLINYPDFQLPKSDPALTKEVVHLLGSHADRYGIGLLDLSDMKNPRYAEWNGHVRQNPGSVGKLMVALAIFQGLADAHPDDIEARKKVLRETIITADKFSVYDFHTVPVWNEESRTLTRHPIQVGQKATLYTYLDWMLSPSSNSAAAMMEKQVILLSVFGKNYPPSPEEEAKFFSETSRSELGKIFLKAIEEPVTRNGLNIDELRQGSFFTHEGKKLVPGTSSYATPRELMKYLVKMEQGKLVDVFSSREIKRLLYVTERRIRYASSGALRKSAVYFKSGSLYSCEPEEGFTCTKYHGNKRNYMNSAAIVESPAGQARLYYMTTVLSNVLKMNSAQDHRDLARAIQAMLLVDHPKKKLAPGEKPASLSYGEGFIGYQSERQSVLVAVDTQEALLALGYDIGDIDGAIGKRTRGAIQTFQASQGLARTGKASEKLVKTMRRVATEKGLARPTEESDDGS
jgi:hypothetical protein